jgi:hypothetical protein
MSEIDFNIHGNCPVQGYAFVDGWLCYFRARDGWTFSAWAPDRFERVPARDYMSEAEMTLAQGLLGEGAFWSPDFSIEDDENAYPGWWSEAYASQVVDWCVGKLRENIATLPPTHWASGTVEGQAPGYAVLTSDAVHRVDGSLAGLRIDAASALVVVGTRLDGIPPEGPAELFEVVAIEPTGAVESRTLVWSQPLDGTARQPLPWGREALERAILHCERRRGRRRLARSPDLTSFGAMTEDRERRAARINDTRTDCAGWLPERCRDMGVAELRRELAILPPRDRVPARGRGVAVTPELVRRVDAWLRARGLAQTSGPAGALARRWPALVCTWALQRRQLPEEAEATAAAMGGVLLALVREAWGDPTVCARACPSYDLGHFWRVVLGIRSMSGGSVLEHGGRLWWTTEAEALVAALEAAP